MKKANFIFVILFCLLVFTFSGCTPKSNENNENNENYGEQISNYKTDLTKISSMIIENVNEEVNVAAKEVIEAFLQYENNAQIHVSGNSQRFMNDMAYVIHCTCPLFGAYTDFNEMTSYDKETGSVSWDFYVEKDEFNNIVQSFYKTSDSYLSQVEKTDSDSMKAMLLYYALINGLNYDYDLIGEEYNRLSKEEANLKSSPYYVLENKSGICTNIAQAYMFLCTQVDIPCGTVLHTGGSGMHMWNIVKIDDKFYYCDPTWDANGSLKYFGMTATDRASWAGEYSLEEGSMLSLIVPQKYDISSSRFETMRSKLPVEISDIHVDKKMQTIKFLGYDYEYVFECK